MTTKQGSFGIVDSKSLNTCLAFGVDHTNSGELFVNLLKEVERTSHGNWLFM